MDTNSTKREEISIRILFKFGEIQHLDSLRKTGELYVNPLSFFQTLKDNNPRQDPNEDIYRLFQPEHGTQLTIGEISIPMESLIGPIRLRKSLYTHVFCCTGLYDPMKCFDDVNLYNPSLFLKFGNHFLAITNPSEFLKRLEQAITKFNDENQDNIFIVLWGYDKVEYIDLTTHNNEIGTFRKDLKYQEEEEFRIVFRILEINPKLEEPSLYNEPIVLDLGSLEDITEEIKSTQNLKILYEKVPSGFTVDISTS